MKLTLPIAVAASLLGLAALPRPAAAQDFPQIDKEFICPENMQTDQQRREALKLFMDSVSKARPDETMADAILYRRSLLTKHNCVETLQNIRNHEAAVAAGQVLDQAWLPISQGPPGLAVAVDYIKPYTDPRATGERSVETYVKATFPAPQTTDATHVSFDTVISRAVYYCRSQRYALIENDYFLAGKQTLKDPTPPIKDAGASIPLYPITPRPPGSLNDAAAHWVCGASTGATARLELRAR